MFGWEGRTDGESRQVIEHEPEAVMRRCGCCGQYPRSGLAGAIGGTFGTIHVKPDNVVDSAVDSVVKCVMKSVKEVRYAAYICKRFEN